MRSFLLKNRYFFITFTVAGWALRAYFLKHNALIAGDSLIYGDIAKTWLQEGVFGMRELGVTVPTLVRLPGYPAFLVAMFKLFGVEHYTAVLRVQLVIDLVTCFLVAEAARRMASERAARMAFILATLCPFTASYCATPLTETISIFFVAGALLAAVCALEQPQRLRCWLAAGIALGASILLRPDGGILLGALLLYVLWRCFKASAANRDRRRRLIAGAMLLAAVSLAPLVPWTLRNWRVFHVFQPLAPRYANTPDEFVPMGFNRWIKTWCVEFASTNDVYWKVPGEEVNFEDIPARAFDDLQQRERTEALIERYNQSRTLPPQLDAEFGALARERVHHSYFRYYVWLPLLRVADMWLRPRTEMLNVEIHWWDFEDHTETVIVAAFLALNAFYLLAAGWGMLGRPEVKYGGLLLLFMLLRSLTLATLENPEPRYTLECFPAVMVLAGAGLAKLGRRRSASQL
ncbi:MAG TPA: glycosyltransferase family 39 protein [Terriglobales bacterium]